jgi:hypothetical protein
VSSRASRGYVRHLRLVDWAAIWHQRQRSSGTIETAWSSASLFSLQMPRGKTAATCLHVPEHGQCDRLGQRSANGSQPFERSRSRSLTHIQASHKLPILVNQRGCFLQQKVRSKFYFSHTSFHDDTPIISIVQPRSTSRCGKKFSNVFRSYLISILTPCSIIFYY